MNIGGFLGWVAHWDGRNNSGKRVASGVYLYTLQTRNFTAIRRMLIMK